MNYGKIKGLEKKLSRIIFGCAIPPMIEGKNVNELLDAMYDLGINTFDTAENYGLSEVSLGMWMKERQNRDELVIITKGCHPYDGKDRVNPEELRKDIEQSFERLGTDYIDIYLLHRDDLNVEVGPLVEVLNEYYKAGKIGVFGGSNWTHERLEAANQYAKKHGLQGFMVSSPNYGLCHQVNDPWGGSAGCTTLTGEENADARAWYVENEMPVIAYSSLGRGMFSGKVRSDDMEGAKTILDPNAAHAYCHEENFKRLERVETLAKEKNCTIAQIALAWMYEQELNVFPVVSASTKERMMENVESLAVKLSEDERKWLNLE